MDAEKDVVGGKYCFSNSIRGLKNKEHTGSLNNMDSNIDYPFASDSSITYEYIYPYEEPEKQYVPFTMDDAENIIGKVVKNRCNGCIMMITNCFTDDRGRFIINAHQGKDLLDNYTFLDGTPCGREIVFLLSLV